MTLAISGYRLPGLYDRTVVPPKDEQRSVDPYASEYLILPDAAQQDIRESEQMLRELRAWTGWSDRALAEVIGTSHPTVAKLFAGESEFLARHESSRRRLEEAYEVVSRAYILAGRDRSRTASILENMSYGGRSARQYLCEGRPNEAYLAVVEAVRPPRRSGMMRGNNPIDPRTATTAPVDED